jgi:hypothetical protein
LFSCQDPDDVAIYPFLKLDQFKVHHLTLLAVKISVPTFTLE